MVGWEGERGRESGGRNGGKGEEGGDRRERIERWRCEGKV